MALGNDYVVKLILEAKAQGFAAFEELKLAMRDVEAEAVAMNAQLAAIRDHTRETSLNTRAMAQDVRQLAADARLTEERLRLHTTQLQLVAANTLRAAEETARLADSLENKLTPSMNNNSASTSRASSTLFQFVQGMIPGQRTAGNITLAILAMTAALSPLSAELAGSLVLFGAWVVGMTAFLGVVTLAVGGLALLTGGVLALGLAQMGGVDPAANLTKAQDSLATATQQNQAAQDALARAQTSAGSTAQVSANQHLAVATAQRTVETATISVTEAKRREESAAIAVTQAQDRYTQAVNRYGPTSDQAINANHNLERANINLQNAQDTVTQSAQRLQQAQDGVVRAQNTLATSGAPTASQTLAVQQAQERATKAASNLAQAQQAVNVAQQQANGPMGQLHASVENLGTSLGQAAVPMVGQILGTANALFPTIQPIAEQLMSWFGDRLPQVLDLSVTAFYKFLDVMKQIGGAWGNLIDTVLAHPLEYSKVFGAFVDLGTRGIVGLMDNLVRLSEWFIVRFPTLEKNAESTFGNLGTVIQMIGRALGTVVDWIIAHWPGVNSLFDATWGAIQAGIGIVIPLFKALGDWFQFLSPWVQFLADHMNSLKDVFFVVALVVGTVVVAAIVILGTALLLAAVIIVGVVWAVGELVRWIGTNLPVAIKAAGAFFSELGDGAHQIAMAIGGFFSELGDGANQIVQAIGGFFSWFGTAIQGVLSAIGGFFSGLGTAVRNTVGTIWNSMQPMITIWAIIIGAIILFIAAFWGAFQATFAPFPQAWGNMMNTISSITNTVWNAITGFLVFIWTNIANLATFLWTGLVRAIEAALNWVWNNVIVPIWNAAATFLTNVWNGISAVAAAVWNAIASTIGVWLNNMWKDIQNIWNAAMGYLVQVWNAIHSSADQGWNNIWKTITDWAGNIGRTVQGVWDGMIGAAGKFIDNLWTKVRGGVNEVIKVLDEFIGATNTALKPILGHDAVALIPHFEEGGVMQAGSGGGKVNKVTAVVGEGAGPEYVIPTETRYHSNAVNLWTQAGKDLQMFAGGGVIGNPYPYGQCTYYVYSRFPGIPLDGNAGDWAGLPLQHVSTPAPGEIVVYAPGGGYSGFGHVAVVESFMQGNQFLVSEMNYRGLGIEDQRWSSMADVSTFLVPGVKGQGTPGGSLIGAAVDVIGNAVSGALNSARGLLGNVPEWLRDLPANLMNQMADGVKNTFATAFTGTGTSAAITTAGGGNLGQWIAQALAITGLPLLWGAPLSVLIGRESSGNPNSINLTDSNARAGHPSQGLMQLIPSNFAKYHVPGTSNNILDPVANIAAGIRYIQAVYGSIFNVQQANPFLPPRGYDSGGYLMPGATLALNNTGSPETVLGPNSMSKVENLLAQVVDELRIANGSTRLGGRAATAKYAGGQL